MATRAKRNGHFLNIFEMKFKVALFVLLIGYVLGLFVFALSKFRSNDLIPEVKMISYKMRKQFADLSTKVRTGLYIKNFSVFDFTSNNFTVHGVVWFEFNKNEIMLNTIDKFSFENSKIVSKSPPHVTINKDKILVRYDVIFEVKTDLNFHRFPLEDHRLSLVLTNKFVSPDEMYFDDSADSLSFIVSPHVFTSNWKTHSLESSSGYSSVTIDQYRKDRKIRTPKAVFTINFEKAGVNKILIIFIPLFAAVLLALFTFLMSFNSYAGKTTLAVTSVTALLGYRFVIQQMSPSVGYFTIADKIYIFFILLSFIVLVFQLLLLRQYMFLMDREKLKKSETPETDVIIYTPRITEKINSIIYFIVTAIFAITLSLILLI